MDATARAKERGHGKVNIAEPVQDGVRTPERDDDLFLDLVDGDESSSVGSSLVLPFDHRSGTVGLDIVAVAVARDLGATGAFVVGLTVRCC